MLPLVDIHFLGGGSCLVSVLLEVHGRDPVGIMIPSVDSLV